MQTYENHDAMQTFWFSVIVLAMGKIEWDLTNLKKIHLLSTCCNVEKENKKNPDFLPFFKTLSLFSRLFPGLENCFANFKTFSRIQDSVQTLFISTGDFLA